MGSGRHQVLWRWLRPAALALIVLLPLVTFVNGLSGFLSATDQRPRAALVSLAHEHDLQALLSTIRQLEDSFNHRYFYDWVIFSTKPLSDEFRSLTSNATSSNCIFEVISGGSWFTSRPTQSSQFDAVAFRDDHASE